MKLCVRILTVVVVAISCLVVALALWPLDRDSLPDFARFLGRLHPLTVHLPIGVFAALVLLELVGLRKASTSLQPACVILLWLLAVTSVSAAIFGILLAPTGAYDEVLLFRHRWLGCSTALLAMGLLLLRNVHLCCGKHGCLVAYRMLLVVVAIVVSAAGHYGGTLTHGAEYLSRYAPGFLRWKVPGRESTPTPGAATGLESKDVFARTVQPVLEQYCYPCHGDERQKGDLRFDTLNPDMINGPDAETWGRILEMVEEAEMPPENKPQPSDAQRQAVVSWLTESLQAARESSP